MKELSFERMAVVNGGGFVEGACAVIGFGGAGIAVRILLGAAINPVAGAIFAIGGIACFVYSIW